MIIEPKVRGFICTTAHPVGCAQHVAEQIDYVAKQSPIHGPKKVLIIGASTGYGLASRIVAAFGAKAQTIGVFFEKEASGKRTASAGWYNTAAFEKAAQKAGLYAKSINGDAFSDAIKQQTIELIQQDWGGEVDLVIYSLASPRRQDPKTGEIYQSVLKPIGQAFHNKTVDVMTGKVTEINIEPASAEEIRHTEKVMGGEDWQLWIDALLKEELLAKNAMTLAYSYLGPELTYPVYRHGTIGKAKEDLEKTAKALTQKLQAYGDGKAFIAVNKALVTQASAAIPVVPLYISLLYKVMKEKNLHEGCIEQMSRLFLDRLYTQQDSLVDDEGRIRLDDWEMRADVQAEVAKLWAAINTENLEKISDIKGYRQEFYRLFGFGLAGVDYHAEVDPNVLIPSVKMPEQVV
jgi:enoyl-[acyl-carrier protein] reductase/trans-2-enoyl-CoA reductase (NAD+)